MTALSKKKLEFIQEVSSIQDEKTLLALMEAYRQITDKSDTKGRSLKSIRQKFDADAIRQRRGYIGHDKIKIMKLIREMDVQEPVELLVAQLTK